MKVCLTRPIHHTKCIYSGFISSSFLTISIHKSSHIPLRCKIWCFCTIHDFGSPTNIDMICILSPEVKQCFHFTDIKKMSYSIQLLEYPLLYSLPAVITFAGINLRCAFAPFAHKTTLGRRKNRRWCRFGASSFCAALWYFMSAPRFFGRPLYRSARLL